MNFTLPTNYSFDPGVEIFHSQATINSTVQPILCSSDYSFGPGLEDCSRNLDFTATFEESILTIAPSVLLLLSTPLRLISLRGQRRRIAGRNFQWIKVVSPKSPQVIQYVHLPTMSDQHCNIRRSTAYSPRLLESARYEADSCLYSIRYTVICRFSNHLCSLVHRALTIATPIDSAWYLSVLLIAL